MMLALPSANNQHPPLRTERLRWLDTQLGDPSPVLRPRATFLPHLFGPDWIIDHHDFTCLLPLSSAAATLQSFYEDVAGYAAIATVPPVERFQFYLGEIWLEVSAPAGCKVDWIIVQRFALDMVAMTKRGYTNTYQTNFVHRPTGKLLTFSLWVGLIGIASRSR